MQTVKIEHGNFTGLAKNYSLYRPSYSKVVRDAILSYVGKPVEQIDFADVGAGTGIWTRLVAVQGVRSVTAVEPNDDMRGFGQQDSTQFDISWKSGSGEQTGLEDSSADLLTMASSFHWVDFDSGMNEFHRVLKPQGCFAALWNPRFLDDSPMLLEIEDKLREFVPNLKRVSSGLSGIAGQLTEKLASHPAFGDVLYLEAVDTVFLSKEAYLGAWWSVNDIRAQAGEIAFEKFMHFVEDRISEHKSIECKYKTRAWIARGK